MKLIYIYIRLRKIQIEFDRLKSELSADMLVILLLLNDFRYYNYYAKLI